MTLKEIEAASEKAHGVLDTCARLLADDGTYVYVDNAVLRQLLKEHVRVARKVHYGGDNAYAISATDDQVILRLGPTFRVTLHRYFPVCQLQKEHRERIKRSTVVDAARKKHATELCADFYAGPYLLKALLKQQDAARKMSKRRRSGADVYLDVGLHGYGVLRADDASVRGQLYYRGGCRTSDLL